MSALRIIKRLTLSEALGFIALMLLILLSVAGLAAFLPMYEEVRNPSGSGAAAQMFVGMFFVYPGLLLYGLVGVSAAIGLGILARGVSLRLTGRQPPPTVVPASERASLHRLMNVFNATFAVYVVALVLYVFGGGSAATRMVLFLASFCAAIVFLIYLAKVARLIGKNATVWVLLTLITQPFGIVVAYTMMRSAVKNATRGPHDLR